MPDIRTWCLSKAADIPGRAQFLGEVRQRLSGLGVTHLSILDEGLTGIRGIDTTYPQLWQDYYAAHDLIVRDPVLRAGRRAVSIQTWPHPDLRRGDRQDALFFRLATEFGVPDHGAVVRIPTVGGHVIVSYATLLRGREWARCFERHSADLHLLAATVSNRILQFRAGHERTLSAREQQVLTWAARGKTAWETASILGICEGTVNQYIRTAIAKLKASSKLHCVVLAMETGQLDPSLCVSRLSRTALQKLQGCGQNSVASGGKVARVRHDGDVGGDA